MKRTPQSVVEIDPEKLSGMPVFRGTRVPIQALFDYIEGGETLEEFLENFPTVSREQALDVLNLAGKFITSERVLNEHFARRESTTHNYSSGCSIENLTDCHSRTFLSGILHLIK